MPHRNTACNLAPVKRMHRLTKFQHDVVGDVDQRVDVAQPASPQALLQPVRATGADRYITNNLAGITRAIAGHLESDGQSLIVLCPQSPNRRLA